MHRPVRKTASNSQKSYSPSFTSYFNNRLAQIAVRVTSEFTDADDENAYLIQVEPGQAASTSNTHSQVRNRSYTDDESNSKNSYKGIDDNNDDKEEEEELESEFEFDLANLLSPNGDLGPVYPVFNRDLLLGSFDPLEEASDSIPFGTESSSKVQIQLKSLFRGEDRNDQHPTAAVSSSSSSSDSEEEELDSIPPRTYCAWTPNKLPSPSPSRCTKSNSTGSVSAASSTTAEGKAKKFRLRDLLKRSKSDGKDGVMLITPPSRQRKNTGSSGSGAAAGVRGKAVVAAGVRASPARESFEYHYYRRGREAESGNTRRKSYLPYKQDLVGFFVTPHGLRKIQLPQFS